jgi:thioredoxin
MTKAIATSTNMTSIPMIDLAGFDAVAARPGVTVLEFTAAWCGPCKQIAPALAGLQAEYGEKIRVVAIDVDHEQVLAQRYDVRAMPTVVLLRDGREVGRSVGARPRAFYAGMLDRALAGDSAIASP